MTFATPDSCCGFRKNTAARSGWELAVLRRLFMVTGMHPADYYDLIEAGIPAHSTAFRPVEESALLCNPFRWQPEANTDAAPYAELHAAHRAIQRRHPAPGRPMTDVPDSLRAALGTGPDCEAALRDAVIRAAVGSFGAEHAISRKNQRHYDRVTPDTQNLLAKALHGLAGARIDTVRFEEQPQRDRRKK